MSHATAEISPALRSWRNRIFIATWLSYVGFYFCRKPFSIAKSSMAKEAGFDATTLGNIGAVYLISYAIGQFLAGGMGTRLGPRRNVLLGMSISVLVALGFGLTLSAPMLMGLMLVNGLAQATGWSGNVGTMAAWFRHAERGRVMGAWATNFTVGALASAWFASWVLGGWGWRWTFWSGAVVLSLVIANFVANQRNRPEDVGLAPLDDAAEPTASARDGDSLLPRGALTTILLVGGFYFFAKLIRYAIWSWVPFFLERNYGLKGDQAGFYSTLFDICGIPGVMVTGWLSDRFFGSRRAGVSLLMVLLMTASCGALYLFGASSLLVFGACLAVVGFSLYGPDALMTGAGAMDIGSRRAAVLATGLISGVGSLGPVMQELVIGKLYDTGGGQLGPIFLMLFGSAALSALFCAALVVRQRLGRSSV
jgi:OPA family sugar phosphate sensor protein UhpC-like MFS transporter